MSEVSQVTFTLIEESKPVEVIKMSKGKFYFRGEEVEDKYEVYERFNEWLTIAQKDQSNL